MTINGVVTGGNLEPQALKFDYDDNYDKWMGKAPTAAPIVILSSSPEVQRIIKRIRNPHEIWNMLETNLDPTGSFIGKQDILHHFRACQPQHDEPLEAYITKGSKSHRPLDNPDNAITNRNFCRPIFTALPSQYAMLLMVLKHTRLLPTAEEAIYDHLDEELKTGLTNELGDASS